MKPFQIFAHRGSSLAHVENTLSAFRAAIAEGATGIETDVRLTSDGVPVLWHDEDLLRLSGDPRRLDRVTWAELTDVSLRGSARAASLDQLLAATPPGVRLNLEVKVPEVLPLLAYRLQAPTHRLVLTSGDPTILGEFERQLPHLPSGPVIENLEQWRALSLLPSRPWRVLSAGVEAFGEELLCAARGLGAELLVWTVNEPSEIRRLFAAGADGVFTDTPATARQALHSLG